MKLSYLYVTEQGATIGISDNRFQVKYKDGLLKSVPIETLEIIEVFGKVQITTQCLEECLKKGINIIFYSTNGSYYGRLISTSHVNVKRQRLQADFGKNDVFKLAFSKRVIDAKIKNQIVIIRRYARNKEINIERSIDEMQYMLRKIKNQCSTIDQLMGYEGAAAKIYFKVIGKLINPDFSFSGRNRRPPLDPFNSMISLGYSIMLNEIYGKLEGKGLNPYFGIMHRDREKHPTLASDLMEEWRAVLIDSTVLSMLNGHELNKEDFYTDLEGPGVFLAKEGFKVYIKKLETKFRTESKYLSYIEYSVSFRKALDLQVNQLVKAIEAGAPELYSPIIIR
jgi:CRISPR-associated endonuclease Cas1